MVRHQTGTCGRELLGGPLRLQHLRRHRYPMASHTAPYYAAGTHHLICTGCPVLLTEVVPGVGHTSQGAEPLPCSSCLPLRMATHLTSRTRAPHTSGKHGYSHQKPRDIATQSPTSHQVKTALARGPDGSTTLAGWHPLFRLMTWTLLRSCCQG